MKLKFTHKKRESGDIWSFFFDPIEPVEWLAGQSIRLELPRATWGYDERRFTISSAPREGHIRITTRMTGSEFKQALGKLEVGAVVDGYNVEGDFIWDDSGRAKLFLAAGIGITPFRSLLAGHTASDDVKLLYQAKDKPPVFGRELTRWLAENMLVTEERLSVGLIARYSPDWQERVVYVSGPEQMVQDIGRAIIETGLPSSQLKTDLFTCYF